MNPYQALANAIVELAVKDYKKALKAHLRYPKQEEYAREVEELERFFHSGWYEMLTDLNAEYLLTRINRMVREEVCV